MHISQEMQEIVMVYVNFWKDYRENKLKPEDYQIKYNACNICDSVISELKCILDEMKELKELYEMKEINLEQE